MSLPRTIAALAITMVLLWTPRLQAQVYVSPKGGSLQAPPSTSRTATFSLTGLVVGQVYTLEWYCSGWVMNCASPQGSSFTASAYGASWPITYSTASVYPSSGTVTLKAFGASSSDSGYFNVDVDYAPPPPANTTYSLDYVNGKLDKITDPAGRVLDLTVAAGVLTSATDPDGESVAYSYDGQRRLTTRTDRRGHTTTYRYANGLRVTAVEIPLTSPTDLAITSITSWDEGGLVIGQVGGTQTAQDTGLVYTEVDGPRPPTDVVDRTRFWVDRWGAPTKIRDALGFETVLTRGDAAVPALVTEVQAPNGFVTRASYDARGNVDTLTAVNPYGPGQGNAVTRYEWDVTWDFVTKVVPPMNDSLVLAYDPETGNRLWQQDARGIASRVTFNYDNPYQLPSSVVLPGGARDSIRYGTALGNRARVYTPIGFVTAWYQDLAGRDTLAIMPIDPPGAYRQRQRMIYDSMNRVTRQYSIGPAMPGVPAETLQVYRGYDDEGNLDTLARRSGPDGAGIGWVVTQWAYDWANRPVKEIAPDGAADSTVYDAAGNPDTVITRRGHTIVMVYDARNGLTSRALPEFSYPSRPTNLNISSPRTIGPYAPYTIPAELHTFTYDANGRLLTADNADAKVKRTYYPSGLIETDSLWIQTVARDNWNVHSYGLRHTYDLNGRQTLLTIPDALTAAGATIGYAYHPQLGSLQSVTDLQGSTYTFGYNDRAELASIVYPGQYSEGFRYDANGHLAADTIWNNGGTAYPRLDTSVVRATRYLYDAAGRVSWSGDPLRFRDTLNVSYTGLGHLFRSKLTQRGDFIACTACPVLPSRFTIEENHTSDALANRTRVVMADTLQSSSSTEIDLSDKSPTYEPGTGRQLTDAGGTPTYFYDAAGNIDFHSDMGGPAVERASFFAADGSLRAVDNRWAVGPNANAFGAQKYVFEEYRYDALGRRVWLRSERWCNDKDPIDLPQATECRTSVLRRTIWDGDRELAEIQTPWAVQSSGYTVTTTPAWWENDVTPVSLDTLPTNFAVGADPNPHFGYVVYTGRQGIDQPVAVTRVNYVMALDVIYRNPDYRIKAPFTIAPFWNTRGDAPVGVFATGAFHLCDPPTSAAACVATLWPWKWSAYDRQRVLGRYAWHGTLLEGKRDKSGLSYSRNRYYDPQSGRFTQEDPIGLAGGLNLYGFAGGDPVNFGDPFGLTPFCVAFPAACVALVGGFVSGLGQLLHNLSGGERPLENVGSAVNLGGALALMLKPAVSAADATLVGRAAAGMTAGAGAGATPLVEGQIALAVVKDGRVLAQSFDEGLSHAAFVERTLGALPEGARVVTVGKLDGLIKALNSYTFHGNQAAAPEEVQEVVRRVFR